MPRKTTHKSSGPRCIFCGGTSGVQFQMFTPRFQPFGTACVPCEQSVTPQQILEAAPLLDQSATRHGLQNCDQIAKARKALQPEPATT